MKLQIFDSEGNEVKINDLVLIRSKRSPALGFYARVKVFRGRVFPFSNFAFDNIVKINEVPADAYHSAETDDFPEYWISPG